MERDLERMKAEFMASLLAWERAAEQGERADKVLPSDVDLDAELAVRFDEIVE